MAIQHDREAALEAAIDSVTRALAFADETTICDLIAERRAMREELAALREIAGVLHRAEEQARREPTKR